MLLLGLMTVFQKSYWSKLADRFLQFPNPCIRVVVTGKQVNRGAEFSLEILVVDYIFTETLE